MPDTAHHLLEMIADDGVGAPAPRGFDGVICFGDNDWWYHNRGHYDLQMMRALTSFVPVLYVNSIGMRLPSVAEGPMFLRRIARKLRSLQRGYVPIAPGFSVLTPFVVPGGPGMALTERLLPGQVRRAAARMGMARPLVWVVCPTAQRVVERIGPEALVYQRTDRTEVFRGVDARRIKWFDTCLKEEADLTLFASSLLHDHEHQRCRAAAYVDHGVDFEQFAAAPTSDPTDVIDLPRPRIGFVGGIDEHTFDQRLFCEVAARLPDASFVLVGSCSLPRGWCRQPNVHALGQRPHDAVAAYMHACDVLVMPWNRSPWISACNPVKLKEYLATGRPVVSTYFHELERYEGLVRVAHGAEAFAAAITDAIAESSTDADAAGRRRERVRHDAWSRRAATVLERLAAGRVFPIHSPSNPVMSLLEADRHRAFDTPSLSLVSPPSEAADAADGADERLGDLRLDTHLERRRALCGIDLDGVIILDGGPRPCPLAATLQRSVLDLKLSDGSLLDHWLAQVDTLTDGAPELPVRVVFDAAQPVPQPSTTARPHVRIHTDPLPFRGPAGVVRDLCATAPDRHVLVIEAARFLTVGPMALLDAHALRRADVTLAVNPDGQPAGLALIRGAVLDLVPPIGFMDLKEQLLPRAIEAGFDVRVATLPAPGTLPLRTRRHHATVVRYLRAACAIPMRTSAGAAARLPDRGAARSAPTSAERPANPRHAS